MKLVSHRRNTVAELQATSPTYGVEVDIRSDGQQLIIHHDPFVVGESFEEWLNSYRHGTLILNVKEEGLERRLIPLVASRGIEDFFFLDQSFPLLVQSFRAGEQRCAVRVSEFESVETALRLAGKVSWVWVDCFSHFPLDYVNAGRLRGAGFKLCLASPELHGRSPETEIPALASLLKCREIKADAVCTKHPELWESIA
jgi:hypothetical protein